MSEPITPRRAHEVPACPPDHPGADRQVPGPGALPGHPSDQNHPSATAIAPGSCPGPTGAFPDLSQGADHRMTMWGIWSGAAGSCPPT